MDKVSSLDYESRTHRRYKTANNVREIFDGVAILAALGVVAEAGFVNMEQLPQTDGTYRLYAGTVLVGFVAFRAATAAKQYCRRLVRNSIDDMGYDPRYDVPALDILREMESES